MYLFLDNLVHELKEKHKRRQYLFSISKGEETTKTETPFWFALASVHLVDEVDGSQEKNETTDFTNFRQGADFSAQTRMTFSMPCDARTSIDACVQYNYVRGLMAREKKKWSLFNVQRVINYYNLHNY